MSAAVLFTVNGMRLSSKNGHCLFKSHSRLSAVHSVISVCCQPVVSINIRGTVETQNHSNKPLRNRVGLDHYKMLQNDIVVNRVEYVYISPQIECFINTA